MTKSFFGPWPDPHSGCLPKCNIFIEKVLYFSKAVNIFFYLVFLIFSADYPRFSIIFNIHYKAQIKSFLIIITVLLNAYKKECGALKKVDNNYWYYDQDQEGI